MGEVYLADDTRLRRRVALKVLRPGDAADARASERLLREARAAARLDHINICTIFDTGEADGHPFIAMQYVDGESLAARLARKPIGMLEAVSLAKQTALALSEAHRHGIVHRDIKPQNIMISASGQAKVLDFGLAVPSGPVGDTATTAARLTEAGAVAGTVQYMSPEQVRGEPVDERSDIFSLGAVLYEIVTRARPFGEGSFAETIAAILTREPARLSESVPAPLRRIVIKCLEKDRGRRYQTARDLAVDLDAAARELEAGPQPAAAAGHPHGKGRGTMSGAIWAVGTVVLIVVSYFVISTIVQKPPSPPAAADYVQVTNFADSAVAPAVSADGTMVAFLRGGQPFLTREQVYIKRLPGGEAKQLTNDSRLKYGLAFTPDGNHVAYSAVDRAGWSTWTVPVIGGEPTQLLPNAAGLTWIDAQRLLYSEVEGAGLHMGVVTSTATRADRRVIYFPPHERAMAHYSALSPDRKWILVVEMNRTGGWDPCRLVSFDGQTPWRPIGPPGSCQSAAWSPDGQWMYFAVFDGVTSHLWRQRFPEGAPEALTSGPATDEQGVAISPDGRSLITSVGHRSSALWMRDASGERLLSPEGFASNPRVSKDGTRVFCLLRRVGSSALQLSAIEVGTGRTESLLLDIAVGHYDISPDETTVAYTPVLENGDRQVWVAALDKRSAPRLLVENADDARFSGNDALVFRVIEGHANFADFIKLDGSGRRRVIDRPIIGVGSATPDGQWAAVHIPILVAARGEPNLAAVPLAGGEPKRVCSGACNAIWSADGRFLFVPNATRNNTLVVPLPRGRWFPDFPADGTAGEEAWLTSVPGARTIDTAMIAPGSDPAAYVFVKRDDQRNLFRVPIR
jgi:tRNA A-37 threonylcarbamoyl transferase component Bud32